MPNPFSIGGHIWIDKDKECFIATNSLAFLNAVLSENSVHKAAEKMGISYRCALKLIDEINRLAPYPVMVRKRGQHEPEFTEYGERLLLKINQLEIEFSSFLFQLNRNLNISP